MNAAWPPSTFDAPLLRALDERGRREVEAAGRGFSTQAGDVVYREAALCDSFFVVVAGRVELRGERSRVVLRGQAFGEEAIVRARTRASTAIVRDSGFLVELPVRVFERALDRALGSAAVERQRRTLERSLALDFLRGSTVLGALGEERLAPLLDASRIVSFARGERVFEAGNRPGTLLFLMEGLVQLEVENDGRVSARGLLRPGDVYGANESCAGVALGHCRALLVPASVLEPRLVERLSAKRQSRMAGAGGVFEDVHRLQMATSLVAIDTESCVRCGHCAWACAELHGSTRLVRRGELVTATLGTQPKTLLLPNACHHCRSPACLDACPTGAIVRSGTGAVLIRDELCTGCGACAKACPWDSIAMAERSPPVSALSPEIAVKCDLCASHSAPACVQACPTEAIVRLDPLSEFVEMREMFGGSARPSPPAERGASVAPNAGLALGTVGVAVAWHWHGAASIAPARGVGLWLGVAAALACGAALAYVVPKRFVRRGLRIKPWLSMHAVVGTIAMAAVAAHAGLPIRANWSSALAASFWLLAGLGVFGSIAYRAIPRALARLERKGSLPEDLPAERAALLDELERALSGRDELVKRIAGRWLIPYARSFWGPFALVVSRRALSEEEAALHARILAALQGRGTPRLAGLDAAIRIAVELRAWPARRVLGALVSGWLVLHVLLSAVFFVLLVVHVLTAWRMG